MRGEICDLPVPLGYSVMLSVVQRDVNNLKSYLYKMKDNSRFFEQMELLTDQPAVVMTRKIRIEYSMLHVVLRKSYHATFRLLFTLHNVLSL